MMRKEADDFCDALLLASKKMQNEVAAINNLTDKNAVKDWEAISHIRDSFFSNTSQTICSFSDTASALESERENMSTESVLSALTDVLSKINLQTEFIVSHLSQYGYELPPKLTGRSDQDNDADDDEVCDQGDQADVMQGSEYASANTSLNVDQRTYTQGSRQGDRSPSPPAFESLGLSLYSLNLMESNFEEYGRESDEVEAPPTPHSILSRKTTDTETATPPVPFLLSNNRSRFSLSKRESNSSRSSSMPLMDPIRQDEMDRLEDYLQSQLTTDVLNAYVAEINDFTTDKRFMTGDDGVDDAFTVDEITQLAFDKKHGKAKAVVLALIELKRISAELRKNKEQMYYIL
ncbi:hypothetical protein SmJEL517_g02434 [Synchytrium microbalum]|uniref:Uncharacterized protein n=1 Tax=Synchytrium microbalum TaxID=1806994 RepID=A0A507C0R3_9FUNG|nr:uncharacterized protein SmJEL517_g02434 [Synchytrium microbalum]TPX35120.1 hypothetical protein SmJEL517_g02434 [Synchytrium microbalum]